MDLQLLQDLATIRPELIFAGGIMALLLIGVFQSDRRGGFIYGLSILLMSLVAVLVIQAPNMDAYAFHEMFLRDTYGAYFKILSLLGGVASILLAFSYMRQDGQLKFEFPLLISFAVLGMMLMLSANDLISLYLGLELQSLALYVCASIRRDTYKSTEAGLKYFVLGALSSGMILYGASLVYGFTGTTNFDGIALALTNSPHRFALLVGMIFMVAGLCFKVSAVPFHMWTPDVYEGAPTPVTAFFAIAPKVAAMGVFVRLLMGPFGAFTQDWQQIILLVSVASMVVGAVGAIAQTNIKRMLAYSSIGHMGYALIGLTTGVESGVRGIIIYLSLYLVMSVGTFACLVAMNKKGRAINEIEELSGLSKTHPYLAFMMAVFMFSMAGIPPMAGFFGKLYIFLAAVQNGFYSLAVIGVLTSVVGAYYYIRIIKVMYFDEVVDKLDQERPVEVSFVLGVSGVLTLLFFLMPSPLISVAAAAAASFF